MPTNFERRSKRTIWLTGKTYPTLEVEVLYIGDHPTGYSDLRHIIVGLTNEQALDFIDRGYNVKVAAKESKFLGVVRTEHLLYLVIDIPKTFNDSKVAEYRLDQRLFGADQATVEVLAQGWETSDGKKGIRLYLESLTFVDKRSGFEVLKDIERNGLNATNDYETYVQSQRDANMQVWSRSRWARFYGVNDRPEISQREFDNRNNRRRSHWNLGDSVVVSGVEYQVGHIQDTGHMWTLRLDRKYAESVYLRVPK